MTGHWGAARKYGPVVLLLAVFAAQCLLAMPHMSPTSDEVPHLAAGYACLKTGDYRLNAEHPPAVKLLAALPLLALDLDLDLNHSSWKDNREWAFGERFVNQNRVPPQTIIFWGRVPMVLLGLGLGLVIYLWTLELYGRGPALLALLLFAFCPNLLANSPLVTTDVGNALFTLLAVYGLYRYLLAPRIGSAALTGVALGLALCSKATSVSIVALYAILAAVFFITRRERTVSVPRLAAGCGVVLAVAVAVILAAYRVTSVGYYFQSLGYFVKDVAAGGRPAFLFGEYSTQGWPYYFLAAMLVKTPLPSLALLAATVVLLVKRRRLEPAWYWMAVPVLFFLAAASFSRLQLGIRYILQVYPFLYILIGGTVGSALAGRASHKRPAVLVVVGLLGWYAVGTLRVFPHYLAYFNEAVGGPKKGYQVLLDSNLDWGQDLPGLAEFLQKQDSPQVILSYFGTASPNTYGITYQDFYSYNLSGRREEHINSLDPGRELFVISANSLQCLYWPDKTIFDWLKQRKPLAVIGHTLFVYDFTEDSEAQANLGVMYLNNRYFKKGERQFKRALAIDPANRLAQQYLQALAARPAP
jgi:4-amino-4-deoxy-L-arabinose transferase-like glycosyltransferase